jgi:hypothetical protein
VTDRFNVELVVPIAQLPNASGLGVAVAMYVAATPVPLSATGELVTGTLASIDTVPFADPAAVGVNTMLIVQLLLATRVPPQVPPERENGAVTVTPMPVS